MTDPVEFTTTLAVPSHHPSYAGHFPGHPVVPGALLLQWLQSRAETSLPGWQLLEVPSVKFQAEVAPGETLTVEGPFDEQRGRLSLTVYGVSGPKCKASFILGRRESA